MYVSIIYIKGSNGLKDSYLINFNMFCLFLFGVFVFCFDFGFCLRVCMGYPFVHGVFVLFLFSYQFAATSCKLPIFTYFGPRNPGISEHFR